MSKDEIKQKSKIKLKAKAKAKAKQKQKQKQAVNIKINVNSKNKRIVKNPQQKKVEPQKQQDYGIKFSPVINFPQQPLYQSSNPLTEERVKMLIKENPMGVPVDKNKLLNELRNEFFNDNSTISTKSNFIPNMNFTPNDDLGDYETDYNDYIYGGTDFSKSQNYDITPFKVKTPINNFGYDDYETESIPIVKAEPIKPRKSQQFGKYNNEEKIKVDALTNKKRILKRDGKIKNADAIKEIENELNKIELGKRIRNLESLKENPEENSNKILELEKLIFKTTKKIDDYENYYIKEPEETKNDLGMTINNNNSIPSEMEKLINAVNSMKDDLDDEIILDEEEYDAENEN